MEQTTTWLCPVCEKMLEPNDLIVDGLVKFVSGLVAMTNTFSSYFDNILKSTPDSVEEVEVEPNGEWHTADNKFGSPSWVAARRSDVGAKAKGSSSRPASSSPKKVQAESASAIRSIENLVILDSDSENEDESRVKKELSPSNGSLSKSSYSRDGYSASTSAPPRKAPAASVIDLTLDSESEDDQPRQASPPPVSLTLLKRKASDYPDGREDEQYKRPRPAELLQKPVSIPLPRRESGLYTNGSSTPSTSTPGSTSTFSRTLPPPIPTIHRTAENRIVPPPSSVSPLTPYDPLPTFQPPAQRPYAPNPYTEYTQRPPPIGAPLPPYNSPDPRRLPPPPHVYNSYISRPNGASGGAVWP